MKTYLWAYMSILQNDEESKLLEISCDHESSDERRLAAALLLCTCDSNERKAGE